MTIMQRLATRFLMGTGIFGMIAFSALVHAQSATFTSQLDIGSTGPEVTALQQFLAENAAIYPQGLVTGYYGSLTAAAVARWQAANGIAAVGRVGPITLAALNSAMGSGSTGSSSTTTGGANAPILSAPTVSNVTASSASIAWTSNESANALVMYGTSWPFLFATAPSATGAFGTTQNVTLNGLAASTNYYVVVQSTDSNGNYSYWYPPVTFTTLP